ncbi:MAG: DUF1638 domain-containing protein [Acidimicrobiia bacterium]|nr:DUF1638 domain-containing protein [Actinomycetota bacterium]MBL6924369.1 DUF1638 domain-containing protein [Acidimicrobiia bacterium]MBL6926632.1 DUF1638 domain-containing protein [Acidimicrobiia bacterium]
MPRQTGAVGGRTLIVACGALVRELLEVVRVNDLDQIDVECLPASYHNTPALIPDAVESRVRSAHDRYDRVFVGYADCGTGGRLDAVCAELGVERLPGAHCYEFFTGAAPFGEIQDAEIGTFYLTDYLVRHFDRIVIAGLGLDRYPQLLPDYFGNYTRLLYLAQTDDPDLVEKGRSAAKRLGLRYEVRRTGYGELETSVVHLRNPTAADRVPRVEASPAGAA